MTQAPSPSEGNAQQRVRSRRDKRLVTAIVALLSAGALGYGLMVGLRGALEAWGLSVDAATFLADLASTHVKPEDLGLGEPGPVELHEERQARVWRAIYILAAAERLNEADDLAHAEEVERGYFARHVAAEERRQRAAALVDLTAKLLGDRKEEQVDRKAPLLGWRSVLDQRTTPECRWANGRNFRADQIPIIGLPGAVHPRCRCTSGPPIPNAPLIPGA